LIYGPPEIVLLAIYFYEDFIYIEGIAVSPVLSLQSPGINGTELDAPQSDGLSTDGNASFSEQVFYIQVSQVEPIVQPESLPHEVLWVRHRK
jgi:hypothetical protein